MIAWPALRICAVLRFRWRARPRRRISTAPPFKVARIYVTLAADGRSANFKFAPDEQEFKCMMASAAFAPVPGAWGRQGWTTAVLAALSAAELNDALETAWRHALPKRRLRR